MSISRRLTRQIEIPDKGRITSKWAVPAAYDRRCGIILAHGAGTNMEHPFLDRFHQGMVRQGRLSVKFNFPYTQAGRKAPDRRPILLSTWERVHAAVLNDPELSPSRLFLAGKSMGGRMASLLVASGVDCDGLIFLGYPLHPAGKPEACRVDHFRNLQVPCLFIQGSRDALCRLDLLERHRKALGAPSTLHVIDGADHGFKVLKRLKRSENDVMEEIIDTAVRWMKQQKSAQTQNA